MEQPLSGLVVVEVAATAAPAFTCALLADFGATVYVAEALPEGSAVRRLGPASAMQGWWESIARGKRSVAFDPLAAQPDAWWVELLRTADAVVTDVHVDQRRHHPLLRPLEDLERPPLVLDLFPTGADQPRRWGRAVGAGFTAAVSGMAALTGPADGAPVLAEAPLAESLAGAMGAMLLMAELAALRHRARPAGPLSMATHEAVQRMIEWQLPVATLRGRAEARCGNNFPLNAGISNMHRTCDGKYVAISAANQAVAMRLLRLIGGEAMAADERFASPAARAIHMDVIYSAIDAWVGERSQAEVLRAGSDADVVIGPIYEVSDILADEHIRARGNLRSMPRGALSPRPAVGVVPGVFGAPSLQPAPEPGQHTDETRRQTAATGGAGQSMEHDE